MDRYRKCPATLDCFELLCPAIVSVEHQYVFFVDLLRASIATDSFHLASAVVEEIHSFEDLNTNPSTFLLDYLKRKRKY